MDAVTSAAHAPEQDPAQRWVVATDTIEQLQKAEPGSGYYRALRDQLDALIPAGVYEHYKSTPKDPMHYLVLAVGEHTERKGEFLVTCVALYPPHRGRLAHRPVLGDGGFLKPVVTNGITRPRLRYMKPLRESLEGLLRANGAT